MTYQSPVQWSITKDLLFMEHLLFCAFVGCLRSGRGRCDYSSMWASLYKQPAICQRYASIFKVLFFFEFVFCICFLLWWNEKVALTHVGCRIRFQRLLVYVAQKGVRIEKIPKATRMITEIAQAL